MRIHNCLIRKIKARIHPYAMIFATSTSHARTALSNFTDPSSFTRFEEVVKGRIGVPRL